MIHLITKGGLGNQMFQYAFALQVQRKHTGEEVLINGFYQPLNGDNRMLGLSHFKLSAASRVCSPWLSCLHFGLFLLRTLNLIGLAKICKTLGKRAKANLRQQITDNEEKLYDSGVYFSFNFFGRPEIRFTKGTKHIFGYHLSPLVVLGIEEELRRSFVVTAPISETNQELRREIESQNAVCLHVRRGDYRFYKQLQVCTEYYYKEAMRQACEILENPVFYIFSTGHDDIEWIKAHYQFKGDIRYVDLNNVDYEELYLMMACKHFIISNSTFSWWAAFLGGLPEGEKRVWAPKPWFAGTSVEMYLPSWTVIETLVDPIQ